MDNKDGAKPQPKISDSEQMSYAAELEFWRLLTEGEKLAQRCRDLLMLLIAVAVLVIINLDRSIFHNTSDEMLGQITWIFCQVTLWSSILVQVLSCHLSARAHSFGAAAQALINGHDKEGKRKGYVAKSDRLDEAVTLSNVIIIYSFFAGVLIFVLTLVCNY